MIKKTRNKLIASLLLAAMIIPAFSINAKAETIEIPIPPDIGETQVTYTTMDTSKTETYAQRRERGQNLELQRAAEEAASKDKTGYPFVKISAASFLKDFGENGYRFDSARYAADYPDVAAVVGTSQEALWNHYKTVGIYEGRYAHNKLDYNTNDLCKGLTAEEMMYLQIVETAFPSDAFGKYMISDYDWMIDFAKVYTPQMTDRQKAEWVNKWMCDHYYYGYMHDSDAKHPELFEKYGDPHECGEYAGIFRRIMRTLGVPTIFDNSTPYYTAGPGHAWDRVYVDGRWYVVDVTWNDGDQEGGVEGPDNTNYLFIDRHPVYQLYDDVVGYVASDVTLKDCY